MENETDMVSISIERYNILKSFESKSGHLNTKRFLAFFNIEAGSGYQFITLLSNDEAMKTLIKALDFANRTIEDLQDENFDLRQQVAMSKIKPKKWYQIF